MPGVERAVARVVHVVETLAQIDDVRVSTTTFDERVRQIAG
jgi:hypothetical protein